MSVPYEVDIPHQLGRATARARIDAGIGRITEHVPGGVVNEKRWDGDTLHLTVEALGQRVTSAIDVLDDRLHVTFTLPPFLSLFGEKIRATLQKEGPKLLK